MSMGFARAWAWMRRAIGLWPRSGTRRDPLGQRGERIAAAYLRRRGYRVLARNLRVRAGEADLVCLDPDGRTIVVVEVKARRRGGDRTGASQEVRPEAAVGQRKRAKLRSVVAGIRRMNRWEGRPMRVDVVAVEWEARRRPIVRHHLGGL